MLQVSFRIRRPAALAKLTQGNGVVLHTWCNLETDFVQVVAEDRRQAKATMAAIVERFGPNLVHAGGTPDTALVACPAKAASSVSVLVERHSGLVLPPVVSSDGWDTFRIVLFDDAQALPFLRAVAGLGEVETISKRPVHDLAARGFFVPSAELFDGLTRRQAEALLNAARLGYYQEPRGTTLAQVAKRSGLGRASFEEHLRKGENKLLRALAPLVAVRIGGLTPTRPRGRPFAGNNRHNDQPPVDGGKRRANRK